MANSESVINLIKDLTKDNFYGNIDITFKNGQIVHCRKIESLKISTTDDSIISKKSE